jgi:neopullulanase
MTYPGAPSIYYGDEIGLCGGHDPANRGAFPWHRTDTWDKELLHEFQRLIALRHALPALRRGSFRVLHAEGDVFAHARQLGDESVIVAFNAGRSSQRLDIALHGVVAEGAVLERAWSHDAVKVEHDRIPLVLGPRSSVILATPRRAEAASTPVAVP